MLDYTLSAEKLAELRMAHRKTRDKREADRIKAVVVGIMPPTAMPKNKRRTMSCHNSVTKACGMMKTNAIRSIGTSRSAMGLPDVHHRARNSPQRLEGHSAAGPQPEAQRT